MSRVLAAFVAGLAVLALAVAGCGGDDTDEGAAATEPAAMEAASEAPAEGAMAGSEAADTGAAAGGATAGTLTGTVGPGFTIQLAQDGQPVTSLAPGTYTIEIDDRSASHNFHLTGPGVDEATEVGETGMTTWTVTFEAGDYEYVCDPHASSMNGSFTVG